MNTTDGQGGTVPVTEAARLSGLSVRAVYKRAERGMIPGAFRLGARFFIPEEWARDERARRSVPEGYISTSEALNRTGISRQRLNQLIRAGKVEADFRQVGARRFVWVNEQSLEQWSATKTQRKNQKHGGVEHIEPENVEEPEGQNA